MTEVPPPKKGARVEGDYDISRYVPPLKRHVEELLTSGLPMSEFPFVGQAPEALVAAARDASAGKKAKDKSAAADVPVPASGKRLIVISLGGLTYSELRGMHEASRALNRELIVGGTAMLTPRSFLLGLKDMKQVDSAKV